VGRGVGAGHARPEALRNKSDGRDTSPFDILSVNHVQLRSASGESDKKEIRKIVESLSRAN
jgi:hypothetical protein